MKNRLTTYLVELNSTIQVSENTSSTFNGSTHMISPLFDQRLWSTSLLQRMAVIVYKRKKNKTAVTNVPWLVVNLLAALNEHYQLDCTSYFFHNFEIIVYLNVHS